MDMARVLFIFPILALFVVCPACADEYFRCKSKSGETRVVKHIEMLPEKQWVCESFTMVAIRGESNQEDDKDDDVAEDKIAATNQEPTASHLVNEDPEGESFSLQDVVTANAAAKKKGVTAFESEKEMETFVRICSGGGGHDCTSMMREIMGKAASQMKKKQ
jgi:hypothetical protein